MLNALDLIGRLKSGSTGRLCYEVVPLATADMENGLDLGIVGSIQAEECLRLGADMQAYIEMAIRRMGAAQRQVGNGIECWHALVLYSIACGVRRSFLGAPLKCGV